MSRSRFPRLGPLSCAVGVAGFAWLFVSVGRALTLAPLRIPPPLPGMSPPRIVRAPRALPLWVEVTPLAAAGGCLVAAVWQAAGRLATVAMAALGWLTLLCGFSIGIVLVPADVLGAIEILLIEARTAQS